MVTMAIDAGHRHGKKIGIVARRPSDYPEFAEFVVQKGITSISLNLTPLFKRLTRFSNLKPLSQ
jgi:pyruvate,water dikinase